MLKLYEFGIKNIRHMYIIMPNIIAISIILRAALVIKSSFSPESLWLKSYVPYDKAGTEICQALVFLFQTAVQMRQILFGAATEAALAAIRA